MVVIVVDSTAKNEEGGDEVIVQGQQGCESSIKPDIKDLPGLLRDDHQMKHTIRTLKRVE